MFNRLLNRFCQCFAILVVFALSAPVFARSVSQPLVLNQPATIGGTTLQPGHYKFVADLNSDQIRVERDGKLVANVTGTTVMLNNKSPYDAVVFDGRRVHEIQFAGKTQAIDIPNS